MQHSIPKVLNGKWTVLYRQADFDYKTILETLSAIRDWMENSHLNCIGKYISFDTNFPANSYSLEYSSDKSTLISIHILLKNTDISSLIQDSSEPVSSGSFSIPLPVSSIKKVGLSYPFSMNDKRWKSIELTSSSLFLGSALYDSGFEVKVTKQPMPVSIMEPTLMDCDLIGFTLFEDLFLQTQEFLSRMKENYRGLMAAGGPLVTLTPMQAVYHLPQVNLFVRGEAEFVFPGIIRAVNENNIEALMDFKGFLFQVPGVILISELGEINRPALFDGFEFNLDFLEKHHFEMGLELNLSRGCNRGCVFCSAVQGRELRKLPVHILENLLHLYSKKIGEFGIQSPVAKTVNINDDDILQDPGYARDIFNIIKKYGFRLWGIQTSVNSFFRSTGELDSSSLDIIDDPSLFVDNKPLVWPGTDAFLVERGKKLGKRIPSEEKMVELMEAFEKRGIANYHYWISSDHLTDWEEFVNEFKLIYRLKERFEYFGLLAHAPFIVPYFVTPLYKWILRLQEQEDENPGFVLKYKKILKGGKPEYTFPLVERVETRFRCLNRLLNNERTGSSSGFFDYLSDKDYYNCFLVIYHFVKQERLEAEASDREAAEKLFLIENDVETILSNL